MPNYPQVVLFGSIQGGWREAHSIPVLEELKVSYFNPTNIVGEWTKARGDYEAEAMAHCETIIMIFNRMSPGFAGLAEAGWAALGAQQRGQHFILQIDQDFEYKLPDSVVAADGGEDLQRHMQHYATASRHLVLRHAQQFQLDTLHLVSDLDGVAIKLREIYARPAPPTA